MIFALSTRWNAFRHASGEAMIEEILDLGFDHVELGYDLTADLVPGVRRLVEEKAVHVSSIHNYCPVPVSAPQATPELFQLVSPDRAIRRAAVKYTSQSIEFAAEIGASTVVFHAGRLRTRVITSDIIALHDINGNPGPSYEKKKMKLIEQRDRAARKCLPFLYEGLDALLPILKAKAITLAVENLPSWEAVPTEIELKDLFGRVKDPCIGYWHDIGHGEIRRQLWFVDPLRWLERFSGRLAGLHIHDVIPPAQDHLMPPKGNISFQCFKNYALSGIPLTFEPAPGTPAEDIQLGLETLRRLWEETKEHEER